MEAKMQLKSHLSAFVVLITCSRNHKLKVGKSLIYVIVSMEWKGEKSFFHMWINSTFFDIWFTAHMYLLLMMSQNGCWIHLSYKIKLNTGRLSNGFPRHSLEDTQFWCAVLMINSKACSCLVQTESQLKEQQELMVLAKSLIVMLCYCLCWG